MYASVSDALNQTYFAFLCRFISGLFTLSTSTCVFFTLNFLFFPHTFPFKSLDKPWSQLSSLLPPRSLPLVFIAHRVQQSHCSSIFHRVLLTHALVLSASQFMDKKKSQRIYTSMHSAGLELTKLTCTRLEDNLIRHRGDRRISITNCMPCPSCRSSSVVQVLISSCLQ